MRGNPIENHVGLQGIEKLVPNQSSDNFTVSLGWGQEKGDSLSNLNCHWDLITILPRYFRIFMTNPPPPIHSKENRIPRKYSSLGLLIKDSPCIGLNLGLGILCNCIFYSANLLFTFKSLFLHFLPIRLPKFSRKFEKWSRKWCKSQI